MEKTLNPQVLDKGDGSRTPRNQLADVLPQNPRPWYLTSHLLNLNLCIGVVLLSATSMGFDGSMMNGLQGLDSFMGYFGHPNGTWLGLMNGVMFIGGVSEIGPRYMT